MNIITIQGNQERRSGIHYEYDSDSKPLGEGGMGRVFKGYRVNERTGERHPVAIKAIYDNIPDRVVERARRESEIQLDHENLIRMYGFVETIVPGDGISRPQKHYHVIMELLVGVTLEDVINGITCDSQGLQIPFAAELYTQYKYNRNKAVLCIMKPILSGLMTMHDRGYIHRDIDPSNIMITIDNKIKLIDFGICKQIVSLESQDKSLTASGVFMGKVNYAAPELVLGDVKNQNSTTDIYAMGVLLYQLCTGHLPFTGTDQDILAANLRSKLPMKDVRNNEFKRVINKATEKVQTKRYGSVAEFRVDLERIEAILIEANDGTSRFSMKWIVLSACLILIGFFVWYKFGQLDSSRSIEPVYKPSADELYKEAAVLLANTDSLEFQTKGMNILRTLAIDSLYKPAMIDYNIMLLHSNVPEDMKVGYDNLCKLAEEGVPQAMYECGLTLSGSNMYLKEPLARQYLINLKPDLIKANEFLEKAIAVDTTDYKSVYWVLNNLIELKLTFLSREDEKKVDKKLTSYFKMFEERVKLYNDDIAEEYKNAVQDDIKKTLWNWDLLK